MFFISYCSRKVVCTTFPVFHVSISQFEFVTSYFKYSVILLTMTQDDADIIQEIHSLFARCNILNHHFSRCTLAVELCLFCAYSKRFYNTMM